MKKLLLSSSSIKPVNIRIVSNGVQCADLKMLKENICISDIKDVLDGRLVNWLNNIGEKDLADKIKENFPMPDSLNEKEYYLCELLFDNFTQKEYIQVLLREKMGNLFVKEINRLPDLLVEAYNYCSNMYPISQWKAFFDVSSGTSNEYKALKETIINECNKIEEEKHNKMSKDADEKKQIDYFSMYLRSLLNSFSQNPVFGDIAKRRAESILIDYKKYLNPEYQILAEDFISSFESFYFYDRQRIKGTITRFLKRYNLRDIKL